ncbi:hypothetical protein PoMZ_12010, partial [Pyricularia oryzae]
MPRHEHFGAALTAYWPRGDGQLESFNGHVNSSIHVRGGARQSVYISSKYFSFVETKCVWVSHLWDMISTITPDYRIN